MCGAGQISIPEFLSGLLTSFLPLLKVLYHSFLILFIVKINNLHRNVKSKNKSHLKFNDPDMAPINVYLKIQPLKLCNSVVLSIFVRMGDHHHYNSMHLSGPK